MGLHDVGRADLSAVLRRWLAQARARRREERVVRLVAAAAQGDTAKASPCTETHARVLRDTHP